MCYTACILSCIHEYSLVLSTCFGKLGEKHKNKKTGKQGINQFLFGITMALLILMVFDVIMLESK